MHQSLPNTIDYVEIPSRNLVATKKFFSALFGWSFVDYGPDYASFDDGRMTGGFFASEKTADVSAGAPLLVFYHGALEKMKTKVVDLGGQMTREIFEFPGGRRFHFREPGGSELAIWSDK
ncbi:MAG TPA: VOC family protein [Chthoniobacterales bacterium]|nr:VOC family protein [Chthoniobacterales bacterium]